VTSAGGRLQSALFTILGALLALLLGVPVYYGVVAAAAIALLVLMIDESSGKRRNHKNKRR
jgi:hypothetical protein